MQKADRVTSVLLLLLGGYILVQSLQLGMTRNGITGPGFISFWVGVGILLSAAFLLAGSFKTANKDIEKDENAAVKINQFDKDSLIALALYIGGAGAVVLLSGIFGIMLPICAYMCVIAKLRGVKTWGQSVFLAVAATIVIYVLFDVFLGVPLPWGMLIK
jgi:ABC-type nickel/cobalt efflux system permease component RcnA